jgi:2-polyprenyl-6-methoxyphenol hydroxylase-like FAD-dependent oxidoreductase
LDRILVSRYDCQLPRGGTRWIGYGAANLATRTSLDVGIIGCGFAGAAVATLLARAGHRIQVYERVPQPGSVGAGILLQPTGLAVLAQLGLFESLRARGSRVGTLRARTHAGAPIFELRYERLAPGLFGLGMHRGALFAALLAALRGAGAVLRAGVDVQALDVAGERPRVLGEGGAALGEHDLVLVADGARSRLRGASPIAHRARPYPWGALWFVGEDPESRFAGTLSQVCEGTEFLLGFLPSGLGAGSGTTPLVSLFWSVHVDRLDVWRAQGLAAWKRAILRYEPRADALLEQIRDPEQVLVASYVDVTMRRLHHGRVAYLGDAAHATSPQLGQGTNLALLDAAALAAALEDEPDVHTALRRYEQARRAHVRFYGLASRWLTPFFQSDHGALAPLRDLGFPLLPRIPGLEGQMLRTLSGVKRGVLRRSLALAPLLDALRAAPAEPVSGSRAVAAGG